MRLVCEKYKETMAADQARCRHAQEYCKFRSACMIHFLSQEKGRSGESGGRQEACEAPAGEKGAQER